VGKKEFMLLNHEAIRSEKPVQVVLVDDHAVVRKGTRDLLESFRFLQVQSEFDSGEALLEGIGSNGPLPDLLLLDLNLPGKNGLSLIREIRDLAPHTKIVLFSAFTDRQYVRRAMALKVDGYLSKTMDTEALKLALQQVLRQPLASGTPVLSKDVEDRMRELASTESNGSSLESLTPREQETLLHVAQGLTNRQIADTLVVSVKTVDSHVANLIKKLEVSNRSQLTAFAYDHGLL
jgi:DNA-binding NarL/FixJ family response regulator